MKFAIRLIIGVFKGVEVNFFFLFEREGRGCEAGWIGSWRKIWDEFERGKHMIKIYNLKFLNRKILKYKSNSHKYVWNQNNTSKKKAEHKFQKHGWR